LQDLRLAVVCFLDSTAADCPLTYGPFTLYATLDAGLMSFWRTSAIAAAAEGNIAASK
jgi:hypothetical protein